VGWQFIDKAKRFFNTVRQKFLEWGRALGFGAKAIEAATTATGAAVDRLLAGGALDAFEAAFREEIKDLYIQNYLLGIGGLERMTQADWGSIGGSLTEQYRWLNGFMQDIADGKLSEEQIRARAGMYLNSSREAYERAHGKCARELGMDTEEWHTDPAKENCEDCLAFEAEGPQPLGRFPIPGAGATRCLTNCGCVREFSNRKTGEEYGGEE
jgi:hypothetical protein